MDDGHWTFFKTKKTKRKLTNTIILTRLVEQLINFDLANYQSQSLFSIIKFKIWLIDFVALFVYNFPI